MLRKTR